MSWNSAASQLGRDRACVGLLSGQGFNLAPPEGSSLPMADNLARLSLLTTLPWREAECVTPATPRPKGQRKRGQERKPVAMCLELRRNRVWGQRSWFMTP